MTDFATNGMSSKEMFLKRQGYSQSYPISPSLPNPINFRNPLYKDYGKLNNNNDFIFPDDENLKQVSNSGIYVLNFVADAYIDFEKYMKIEKKLKLLPDSFISTNWEAQRGWFNINEEYHKSMDVYYNNFVGPYLDRQFKHKDIVNFETFLEIFINNFINETITQAPITKTGLISSRFISPNVSGLCIELSTADHGDDNRKVDDFLSSANFEFYATAASKFGFLIDQNAPWRLVANLDSPVMQEYARNYIKEPIFNSNTNEVITVNPSTGMPGIHFHTYQIDENGNGKTIGISGPQGIDQPIAAHEHEVVDWVIQPQSLSVGVDPNSPGTRHKITTHDHLLKYKLYPNVTSNDMFSSYYIPSHYFDIENLKVYILAFYNAYVSSYPVVAVPTYCKTNSPSGYFKAMKIRNQLREAIPQETFDNKYDELFWLKTYFMIRLVEVGVDLSSAKKVSNLNKIEQIYFSLDFLSALNYIQIYLKQYY
jgi:hypothetical protein